MPRKMLSILIMLALVLLSVACTSNQPATTTAASTTNTAIGQATATVTQTVAPVADQQPALPSITAVVAKVKASVVIINDQMATTNAFNQPVQAPAAGSGWIIRAEGYIVTNAHVVAGATNIVVTLSDGRTLPADKVYTDTVTDLAILKITGPNLPALTTGNSNNLQVGDWVVAIGNALGQGISATKGIVSALGISLSPAPGQSMHGLIQTDAAINHGNSGGPLVDMSGEVIGISSYKISQVGVEGMGYAISINEALPVLNTLISAGFIVRPYLGASYFTVDPTLAVFYGLAVNQGILINDIATGSPADKAGLRAGDVITAVDGKPQTDDATLTDYINSLAVGTKIQITYYRGSAKNTVTVTLVQSPN